MPPRSQHSKLRDQVPRQGQRSVWQFTRTPLMVALAKILERGTVAIIGLYFHHIIFLWCGRTLPRRKITYSFWQLTAISSTLHATTTISEGHHWLGRQVKYPTKSRSANKETRLICRALNFGPNGSQAFTVNKEGWRILLAMKLFHERTTETGWNKKDNNNKDRTSWTVRAEGAYISDSLQQCLSFHISSSSQIATQNIITQYVRPYATCLHLWPFWLGRRASPVQYSNGVSDGLMGSTVRHDALASFKDF